MNFYINSYSNSSGPTIFAYRLKNSLESQGIQFSEGSNNRISVVTGPYITGKNNILRLDGLYLDSGNHLGNSKYLNAPIFECYKNFDHIVFQSEYAKRTYEAFTNTKRPHSIIYNGVEDIFFSNQDSIDKPEGFEKVVIASSKWRRHKRIEECIEAFQDKRLKDIALVILGGYQQVDMKNVFCLPMISPEDLPKYYKMADAMIHLCWLDCCPNSVVEGLASGLPVICSHNGGTKELVKNDGVVIKLEEDYKYGKMVDLYHPPKVDINIIVEGILKVLDMPKIQERKDLKITSTSLQYINLFK